MSTPIGTSGFKRAKNAVAPFGSCVTPMRADAPYPIIGASRLDVSSGHNSKWTSLEFTPMYCGTCFEDDLDGGVLGGGAVESFGLGSRAPKDLRRISWRSASDIGPLKAKVEQRRFVPLAEAGGCSGGDLYTRPSSSIIPCLPNWTRRSALSLGASSFYLWSPKDLKSRWNREAIVADGALTDPSGLLALLRRRVKTVIMQCCDVSNIRDGQKDPGSNFWWPAYFGCVKDAAYGSYAMSAAEMNKKTKVFNESELQPLVDEMARKAEKGEPIVVDKTLSVLENKFSGVPGGWEVLILWCYPSISKPFKEALPKETQKLLERDPPNSMWSKISSAVRLICGGTVCDLSKDVPYVPSTMGNYTAPLARVLAETTAHSLRHGAGKKLLQELFQES